VNAADAADAAWAGSRLGPESGGMLRFLLINGFPATPLDDFVEAQCAPFYAAPVGRPSLTPGTYVRVIGVACPFLKSPPKLAGDIEGGLCSVAWPDPSAHVL
jgi:hypothetical protein